MGRFVLPDIHGEYNLLEKMLENWNPDTHQLVQLGDMIDRGKDSLKVVQLLKKYKEIEKASIVRGNHEELFLNFLDEPEEEGKFYFDTGGRSTIHSFMGYDASYQKTPTYIADYIKGNFQEEIEFMRDLPPYEKWKSWVFVHAGVDFLLKDWRNTNERDFNGMSYKRFVYIKNEHPLQFVVGHTHTNHVNKDNSDHVWVSSCGTKFMLDGNASGGGQLNAMIIDGEKNYRIVSVK